MSLPSELRPQRHQASGEGEVARCRPPPPRCVRKWLSREGGGSARLTLPAALGGGASGSGAVCSMPTSFTVVPVEAQGEERQRDGQQREEEDEGEERDRGTGERVVKRGWSTPKESVGSFRAEERVCGGPAGRQRVPEYCGGAASPLCSERCRGYLSRCRSALRERAKVWRLG